METEPEAKRRKVEDEAAEGPKELEQDDKSAATPLEKKIEFPLSECTLNVMPVVGGRVLTPLTDGGLQYLVAGARASAGVKGGRYLFEAQIVEAMSASEPPQGLPRNVPQPRQLLRVGVAAEGSSVFLTESASICFDSEGFTTCNSQRTPNGHRLRRGQTIGILVNLDGASANKDTVSLFVDGVRATQPIELPEAIKGKPLFPVVNFKNLTIHVNFGPVPLAPLPFKCRTFQCMDPSHVAWGPDYGKGKDGKYEVVFPVSIPDEATFDWLDSFLAKNPQYAEISDRAILKWAESSGIPKPTINNWRHSSDKPDVAFGIPLMDDFSSRRVLDSVLATQPRNYIIMEVKGNLVPADRAVNIKKFASSTYKKVAKVVVGEPDEDFKKSVQAELLKEKQAAEEMAWKIKQAEAERKKVIEAQMKEMEQHDPQSDELTRRKEEALRLAEEGGEVKDETKEEVKEEDAVKQEVKEEEKDADDSKPPVATLSEEEQKLMFRKKTCPDVTGTVIAENLMKFALPCKEEGFDEVENVWADDATAQAYFKKWLVKQKVFCRIDDIQPGEYFRNRWQEWQQVLGTWHEKHTEFHSPVAQATRRSLVEERARRRAQEEAQKAARAASGEEGAAEEPPAEADPLPASEVDPMTVPNVLDLCDGEPIFANFSFEDWALLSLRLELALLAHSFKKDSKDEDRTGIHESHLPFYYHKYYMKSFNVRYYGVESTEGLTKLIFDAVQLSPDAVLETTLPEDFDFEILVRRTEFERRERQKRLDSGDDSARLVFNQPQQAPPQPQQVHGGYGGYRGPRVGGGGGPYGATPGPPPPPAPGHHGGGGYGGPPGGKGYGKRVFGPNVCRNFAMYQQCRYGATCRFSHDPQ